jgi:hypothetical protein
MRADASAEFCNFDVFGMDGVSLERGTIAENCYEACVVRAR